MDEQAPYISSTFKQLTIESKNEEFDASYLEDDDSAPSSPFSGEMKISDTDNESELWQSVWSHGRGVLCADRHIGSQDYEDDETMDNTIGKLCRLYDMWD
jgi:hypothetical protein